MFKVNDIVQNTTTKTIWKILEPVDLNRNIVKAICMSPSPKGGMASIKKGETARIGIYGFVVVASSKTAHNHPHTDIFK